MQSEAENISQSQSNVLGENQAIFQDVKALRLPPSCAEHFGGPSPCAREQGATAPWAPAGIGAGVLEAPSVSAEQQAKAPKAGEELGHSVLCFLQKAGYSYTFLSDTYA